MSRGLQNEIPDIADPKPSRNVKISTCEAQIPEYEADYAKLDIYLMEALIIQANLPTTVFLNAANIFKHFLRDLDYAEFAHNTNINASLSNARETSKSTFKGKGRPWKETNAAEMKVFIGICFYMGVNPVGSVERSAYWNTCREVPLYPIILEAMGCTRFY
jgi:hypothetical protein